MSHNFNCKEFVEKISFPRLVGTEGEKKAQDLIEAELIALNISNFKKESFTYTTFFMNFLLRVYNVFIGLLIIILFLLLFFQIFYLIMIFAPLLLIFAFFGREIREKIQFRFTKIGRKRISYNYFVEIPSKEKNSNETQNIVFFAHYDSISHRLNPIFEGILYIFTLVGGTFFSLHVILVFFLFIFNLISSLEISQFVYGFFIAGIISVQLLNKRHNKSFGTVDNATAVAHAFYLLDYFKKNQLKKINLIIVFTGAEEMGDYGADAFIKKYHDNLDKKNSYFFIVDSVAANRNTNLYACSQGTLHKKIFSPVIETAIKQLLESEKKRSYKIKPLHIPPLIHFSSDHAPLKTFGYQFMIFLSYGRIHSKKDGINNYYPEMLDDFNIFIRDLIVQMDKNTSKEKK